MKGFVRFLLISLLNISLLQAQSLTQVLRGTITDKNSGQPLANVKVTLIRGDQRQETTASETGVYRLEQVAPGRYALMAEKDGYGVWVLSDLVVNAGKETILAIEMEEAVYQEDEVRITASGLREVKAVSTRIITVEETQRFAAAYFDPARVATSYPGVIQANDQANHLVVRGNTPNGLAWRLEGVDIVNPNHLSNAGTFTDRLTQNGGGTIILSTQLLGSSTLSTGAFAPPFGNALSGVFDIHLRKGNDEQFEYTAQASLIGIDAAAEGPISREKRSSFLVNYRYSFTGLLGLMGVTFGGEAITFQDLSFNLSFPTEKAGTFTVFGMGGLSSNRFKAPRTDSLRETGKDRFDINFYSNMAAGGITHRILLGEKTVLRSVVAVSTIDSKRDAFYLQDDNETLSKVEYDQLGQTKLSLTSALTHKFSGRSSLTLGAYATQNYSTTLSESRPLPGNSDFLTLADFGGSAWLFQPYANWTFTPASRLTIQAGVHGMFYLLNNSKSIEPRLSLEWNPALRHSLRLAYGLHSQLQLPTLYFSAFRDADGAIVRPNINLGFTRAHHAVLSYSLRLSEILHLRAEPYFQYLFDVPVLNQPGSTFSALNLLESQVNDSLVNEGLGRNYGLELSLERWLRDSWYYVFSGSLYQSQYQASDGIWRDTRYNGRYAFSATGGYEFEWDNRKGRNNVLGINLRGVYTGGFRSMPIDLAASRAAKATVFDDSQGFTEKFPDFYRLDLRITLKRNKPHYTRSIGLDIQNVLNTQNIAFRFYDFYQDAVITKLQLGLIPLFNYRVEF